ncbi:MAG: radical SAM protein [uncultured bacterium]|nr:MAG: radical SAM protein [uncultured bacterium]
MGFGKILEPEIINKYMKKYFNIARNNFASLPWLIVQQARRWFPLDYWWGKSGYALFPEQATLIVTKRCNFGCEKCSSNSPQLTRQLTENPNFRKDYKELSTSEWKGVIDQLGKFFRPVVYFCGGEPTLRPDLFELIRHVKKRRMIAAMTTNGSVLNDKKIEELCNYGLDFISFSIDGPPEYHNYYRRYPKAFEKATQAIEKIVAYKQKHKLTRPNVKITSIIDPEAVSNSYFILDHAKDLGINEVAFGNLMFYTPKLQRAQYELKRKVGNVGEFMIGLEVPNDFNFKKPDFAGVENLYREAQKKYPSLGIIFNPPHLDAKNFYNATKYPKLSPCRSTYSTATISPTGDLYHCQEFFVGNIRKKSFRELWNDPKLTAFRVLKKKLQMPACYRCLEGQEICFNNNKKR